MLHPAAQIDGIDLTFSIQSSELTRRISIMDSLLFPPQVNLFCWTVTSCPTQPTSEKFSNAGLSLKTQKKNGKKKKKMKLLVVFWSLICGLLDLALFIWWPTCRHGSTRESFAVEWNCHYSLVLMWILYTATVLYCTKLLLHIVYRTATSLSGMFH